MSKSNAFISNFKTDEITKIKHFARLKSSSITLENTIVKGAIYQLVGASNEDRALVYSYYSIINLKNVSFDNVKPENNATLTKYRHLIEASGDVMLKKVTIKDCMYNTAILSKQFWVPSLSIERDSY